jgi:hypothetical protein
LYNFLISEWSTEIIDKVVKLLKLNSDCVRAVLLACEEIPDGTYPALEDFFSYEQTRNYSSEDISYSMKKLAEAGFVEFRQIKSLGSPSFDGFFMDITWNGHQFLDNIRNDTVWKKTKEKVSSAVGSTSLQVMGAVASAVSLKLLGL